MARKTLTIIRWTSRFHFSKNIKSSLTPIILQAIRLNKMNSRYPRNVNNSLFNCLQSKTFVQSESRLNSFQLIVYILLYRCVLHKKR